MIARTEPLPAALEVQVELQRKQLRFWQATDQLDADQKLAKTYTLN